MLGRRRTPTLTSTFAATLVRALTLVVCILCTTSFIAAASSSGAANRVFMWVGGALSGILAVLVLVLAYRFAAARQVERIPSSRTSMLIQTTASSEMQSSLEELGLLPAWRINLITIRLDSACMSFWCGVRKPFQFASLDSDDISDVHSERGFGSLRPSAQLRFEIERESKRVIVALTPLSAAGAYVANLTQTQTDILAERVRSLLELPD